MEKLEHSRRILLFEVNVGAKAAEEARNICAVYGTMLSERERQENGFLVLSRIVFTLVTLHVQEDRLNTLMHNDPRQCTRELANIMNCDHSTIVRHLQSMGKVQKSGVWVSHTLSQNHKTSGWPYVNICLLVIDWLVNNIDHSYPVSLVVTRNGVYANIREIKKWLSPNKKQFPIRRPARIHKRCYTSGGTARMCCTTNCFPEV